MEQAADDFFQHENEQVKNFYADDFSKECEAMSEAELINSFPTTSNTKNQKY